MFEGAGADGAPYEFEGGDEPPDGAPYDVDGGPCGCPEAGYGNDEPGDPNEDTGGAPYEEPESSKEGAP